MPELFQAAQTLPNSPRIRLSAVDPGALDAMPWLDAALSPEWLRDDLVDAVRDHEGVLIAEVDGTPIGMAVVFCDSPGAGDATIAFLSVDPARRFRGLGGEAGIELERQLREDRGYERVYAPVPEGRGLAVYFWLRLGFRPLGRGEAPSAPLGLTAESKPGIWMVRDGGALSPNPSPKLGEGNRIRGVPLAGADPTVNRELT
jgi:ribosomal protein S18 acetylase RimI-like enzyme